MKEKRYIYGERKNLIIAKICNYDSMTVKYSLRLSSWAEMEAEGWKLRDGS